MNKNNYNRIISILFILFIFSINETFAQWTEQTITPTPPKLNCVAVDNQWGGQAGWIGGDSGTILYTSNSGSNWLYRNNPVTGNLNIMVITVSPGNFFTSSQYALCSATSASATFIYRTTNQGVNWSVVYQQPNGRIRSIVMYDTSIGYAVGDPLGGRWTILKTTNKGLSFDSSGLYLPQNGSEQPDYNSFFINRSVYNDSSYFFIGTNNSRLYRSLNKGVSWSVINLPFQNVYSIHFAEDPSMSAMGGTRCREWGYAAGNGTVFSTNFGLTWSAITTPGTGDINSIYCDDITYSNYIKGQMIYFSRNLIPTFALQYTSPNGGNYTQLGLRTYVFEGGTRNGWAIKDNGTVSRYNEMWSGIKRISEIVPKSFSLSQNYPNPFNPSTNIGFAIPKTSAVKLIIYDITGREIQILVNEELKAGTYKVDFDGTSFAGGIYFYILRTNDFTQTKKMLMVK